MNHSLSGLLKSAAVYEVAGTLWVEYEGERCFGPGRMQLLEAIHQTGSINKAAKGMGMSYKKAWKMVQELNIQFTEQMVITKPGGEGGGGSMLTPASQLLIAYHQEMRLRFQRFLEGERALLNS